MRIEEQNVRRCHAMRILQGSSAIWDRYKSWPQFWVRRIALREKTRGLVEHDRLLTGIDPAVLRGSR